MKLLNWDGSKYIKTKKDAAAALKYSFEEGGEMEAIASTIGDIAKARGGISKLARETGLTRMTLYKIIKGQTIPSFTTLQKIVKAFGLKLTIK